jgi:hypothetical protein
LHDNFDTRKSKLFHHYRDTGKKKRQSRMDMTETLATEKEAIKNGHYRDTGKKKRQSRMDMTKKLFQIVT